MSNVTAAVFLIVAAAAAFPANACHVVQPVAGQIDRYEAIFVGEVTGMRLRSYENRELGRTDGCITEKAGGKPLCFNLTSDPLVSVFALPRTVIRGNVTDVLELDQARCNRSSLALKERGIFFVNPGGHSAAIVWQSQKDYEDWLERLGVGANGR